MSQLIKLYTDALILLQLIFIVSFVDGNAYCIRMWGEAASGPLHYLHMGFGLGTTVAPLIAQPFLSKLNTTHSTSDIYTSRVTLFMQDDHNYIGNPSLNTSETRIQIPYGICGAFIGLMSVIFYAFVILKIDTMMNQTRQSKSFREVFSPAGCVGGYRLYGLLIMTCIFLMYVGLVGSDVSFNIFLLPLAVESKLDFSKSEAAWLNTGYYGSYTGGRLVAAVLTHPMAIELLLYSEIFGKLAVTLWIILANFGSPTEFWIMTCLNGFFSGPTYPSGIAWMNKYITVSAVAVAVLDLGVGTAILTFSWLSGYVYQYYAKIDLIYLSGAGCLWLLLLLTIAQIAVLIHGRDTGGTTEHDTEDGDNTHNQEDEEEVHNGADERTPLLN